MRLPLIALLICSLFPSCASVPREPEGEDRGSVFTRWIPNIGGVTRWIPKFGGGDPEERRQRAKIGRLNLEMSVQPLPLRLSEVRRMDVTIKLVNRGKRLVQLQFPTAQRIEVMVLDEKGAKVVQWSEDQLFETSHSYLSINPGERVQYDLKLATRDLSAGRSYTIEAFVPGHDIPRERLTLTPER